MMVCAGFSGLAVASAAKARGSDEASAASITSRRKADRIMASFRVCVTLSGRTGGVSDRRIARIIPQRQYDSREQPHRCKS